MNIKLQKGKITLCKMQEVEVTEMTAEEAIETLDLFMEALYEAVPDDLLCNKWSDVLRHMRKYAQDACDNYNI